MNFETSLQTHFPGAVPEAAFVSQTYAALQKLGFSATNSIACVSVCRDERTHPLLLKIYETWGEPFNFSSLAGMLFLGKTGFSAAYLHAPQMDGRERYVHFAMPHIAFSESGEIGLFQRPGREQPSGACGALMAFHAELVAASVNLELDPDDVEQSLLKQRLFKELRTGDVPDLVSLTRLAQKAILADLEHMIALSVNPATSDYAVLSGVQIHASDYSDYVWPAEMYAVVNGQRHELSLA
ncbi:MAG: low-co2 inducible protein lcib [Anaerolineae bacterium]